MRRFLTLVCLLFLALPAGITISGCTRNPAGNYCNGLGYGPKVTDVFAITLQPADHRDFHGVRADPPDFRSHCRHLQERRRLRDGL